jgi:3-methyladenine DNA glycosylase AlkD
MRCAVREAQHMTSSLVRAVVAELRAQGSPAVAAQQRRFFRAVPGGYGDGDMFIGVKVPPVRALARRLDDASDDDVLALLRSPFHEERLLALVALTRRAPAASAPLADHEACARRYLANAAFINSWDLVDVSAPLLVGPWLVRLSAVERRRALTPLADSALLWERRIAVISTFALIRAHEYAATLWLAARLCDDAHDLMHKAIGWMLREVGKRDLAALRAFLGTHHALMPRTMLRYAIEKLLPAGRTRWMAKPSSTTPAKKGASARSPTRRATAPERRRQHGQR